MLPLPPLQTGQVLAGALLQVPAWLLGALPSQPSCPPKGHASLSACRNPGHWAEPARH